jgi:hypothetical protein
MYHRRTSANKAYSDERFQNENILRRFLIARDCNINQAYNMWAVRGNPEHIKTKLKSIKSL